MQLAKIQLWHQAPHLQQAKMQLWHQAPPLQQAKMQPSHHKHFPYSTQNST